ncbi:MAG: hypothetical protein HW383_677, partial [Candidatus Magasanikbacteria bacterium]|nr:hypothetical protein [Candidatus Magasanikbacteria bacterium]
LSVRAYFVSLVVFVALIILGLTGRILDQKSTGQLGKKLWKRLARWGLLWGLIGLVLFFFRAQRVPFFGLRLWWGLWLIGILAHTAKIIWYFKKRVPEIAAEQARREEIEKYLPKKN